MLELYETGVRFRKALDTLIRETATARIPPTEIESFVATRPDLEKADVWLTAAISQRTMGLGQVLHEVGPTLLVEALADPKSSLHQRMSAPQPTPEELQTLRNYLHKLTGMDDSWIDWNSRARGQSARESLVGLNQVLLPLAAWILCVEYVHDLRRPPHDPRLVPLTKLSSQLVKACCDLVAQLRHDAGDAYVRYASEVEWFFTSELEAMTPDDLGQIDTFREEENRVLSGAVEALRKGEWSKAKAWCDARHGERSFWLQREQIRRWSWSLVAEAAEFGETLARHPRPLAESRSLEQAAERYASGAFEVDRAHRRFEQKRLALLEPRLPHFTALQEVISTLRRAHRSWADSLAKDFARLCKEGGFLPPAHLQQRTLYEQVVHPLTLTSEKVAVFLIDAFRYEMATELLDELKAHGSSVDLKPRLAELPTITSVGMNALSPVAQGEPATTHCG